MNITASVPTAPESEDQFLTISQTDRLLKVGRTTGYRLRNREKDPLPVIYLNGIPRIRKNDLIAWLNRQPGNSHN